MKCFFCRNAETEVIDTRLQDDGFTIRRRRQCLNCQKRFTTYERVERIPFLVIKRNGQRESYSEAKLRNGILKAVGKTSVTADQVDAIVNQTTNHFTQQESIEIESRAIGEVVADQLKLIDKVAYIRFASVFRRFVDITEFKKEIKKLK